MTYIATDDLRPGMVVGRRLTGRNNRVLLRAGVALSETHIHALRSLGIPGLEIRGCTKVYSRTLLQRAPGSRSAPDPQPPVVITPQQKGNTAPQRHNDHPRQPGPTSDGVSRKEPAPLLTRQTDILTSAVLEGTGIKSDSALAQVVRLCANRILQSKIRRQIDETAAP
ncbi:MAG TPA: hypothetical protein ENJ43_02355 [Gammaproteobacteria bacterium]|nr:hypothetical protein [Gammaproteobacteria bacterium]